MPGPHTVQVDRDQLDDHGLIESDPAGDDDDEKRNAPAATGALRNDHHIHAI